MKKSKLILCMVCLLSILTLIVACQSAPSETTEEPVTTTVPQTEETTVPVTTEEPLPTKLTSIKLGDTDISEYTIVYAQSPYAKYTKISRYEKLLPVYDFDHETADRLAVLIEDKLGVELKVVEDKKTDPVEHEILIGKTNRTEVGSALDIYALKTDDYTIGMSGTKLAICGGEYGTTWHAVDYLETLIDDTLAEGKTELTFDASYTHKSTYHLVQIGCIGDSITAGVGATDATLFSYPSQLGRYLWKDAVVSNFGNSGKTMRNDLADSYIKTDTYTQAKRAASKIDVFTIMLGTNDSNRDRSWTGADSTKYEESCMEIMEGLKTVNGELTFVLANCPAYFGGDGFGSVTVRGLQKNLVPKLNDAGYPTTFFDMYSVTQNMSANYPDSLHPNDTGHILMAESFAEALQTLIDQMKVS